MSRSRFAKVDGAWRWFEYDKENAPEGASAFVHQDSFKPGQPLRHPVTGEMVDNHTRWNQINKQENLTCVGNDLQSKRCGRGPEKVTEEVILDRIHKAEAITSDPSRLRAWRNQQMELSERNRRLIGGS